MCNKSKKCGLLLVFLSWFNSNQSVKKSDIALQPPCVGRGWCGRMKESDEVMGSLSGNIWIRGNSPVTSSLCFFLSFCHVTLSPTPTPAPLHALMPTPTPHNTCCPACPLPPSTSPASSLCHHPSLWSWWPPSSLPYSLVPSSFHTSRSPPAHFLACGSRCWQKYSSSGALRKLRTFEIYINKYNIMILNARATFIWYQ